MKITTEVREFAAKQSAGAVSGRPGDGRSPEAGAQGEPGSAEGFIAAGPSGAETAEASRLAAIKGMEEMSALYNATGRELYIGAGDGSGIDC